MRRKVTRLRLNRMRGSPLLSETALKTSWVRAESFASMSLASFASTGFPRISPSMSTMVSAPSTGARSLTWSASQPRSDFSNAILLT